MSKANKKKVKRKVNKKKIFIFIVVIIVIAFIIRLFNTNISNIYISGNKYLKDQEIIDISKLSNYPNTISNLSFNIKKRLEKNKYINKANIKKNILLNKVYIEIEENYPLFYYDTKNKTILYNGEEVDEKLTSLTVINSIPKDKYEKLLSKLKGIDIDILNRISELEYSPIDGFKDRFLLFMNDGNYVYITLDKFSTLNKYTDIVKYFDSSEKGIINLYSGEYFDKFDEDDK